MDSTDNVTEIGLAPQRHVPLLTPNQVQRPHYLETIRGMLVPESPIVVLEGDEGMGATTLCAQFCEMWPESSFSLFIKPASKFAYNPDYLRLLLAEQITPWLSGKNLDQAAIDASQFEGLLLKVRRKAKTSPVYFVVDGLHQIPTEDARFVDQIMREVLPIGWEAFRFVITGKLDDLKPLLGKVKAKTFQLIKFTGLESDHLLADVCGPVAERAQLEKLCQGVPARLASVRRLLLSGSTPENILNLEPTAAGIEFVKLEFASFEQLSEQQRLILSVITFGRQELSPEDVARICGFAETLVTQLVFACIFLELNKVTGSIEYRSEAHRRFAERKLETLKSKATALQIESLQNDPTSPAAIRLLPSYYHQSHNLQAIIDLLDPQHYERLLEVTQSVSALKLRAALGARSADELRQASDAFRFALQRSIFSSVSEMGQDSAEVSALVALGQPQRALEIAAEATARESRLTLLAAYARKTVEKGGALDPQTLDYIRQTADQIDFSELGEHAAEIAADVVFVDQDLAFSIIDASVRHSRNEPEREAAYVKLTAAAALGNANDLAGVDQRSRQRVSSDSAQQMLSSLALLAAKFSFEDVRRASEKMEIGRRIYFLRNLVIAGKSRSGVLDVVEFALDQLVSEVGYSPKAKDLSSFAVPLSVPGLDADRVLRLIKRIDAQLGLIENFSTSRDFVELQMRLAHAELLIEDKNSAERVRDTYFAVSVIHDLEIRVDCLALMLRSLLDFDSNGALEKSEGFKAVLSKDLESGIDSLLFGTANQLRVIEGALYSLARVAPESAFTLVARLNTEVRRDDAYRVMLRAVASGEFSNSMKSTFFRIIDAFSDPDRRDTAIRSVIRMCSKREASAGWLDTFSIVVGRVTTPDLACGCLIDVVGMAVNRSRDEVIPTLQASLKKQIGLVDSALAQVNLQFAAAAQIASADGESAIRFYESGEAQRRRLPIASSSAVEIVSYCLSLIVRAYRPLARYDLLTEDLIARFSRLVEMIPGAGMRATIYGDIAARVWCEGKTDLAAQLLKRHGLPLLEGSDPANTSLRSELILAMLPALYFTQRGLALALLAELPTSDQADALYGISRMVSHKIAPYETLESRDDCAPAIGHGEALDLIAIMDLAPVDSAFYSILSSLANGLSSSESKGKINGNQRRDLVTRVQTLVGKKLPDMRNVQHDGYVIVSEAQCLRMLEGRANVWRGLADRADSIPNISDRALAILEISRCIPARHDQTRSDLFEKALDEIGKIPSAYDRFDRLEYFVQVVRKFDMPLAKKALKGAVQLTFDMEQRADVAQCRRSLIDLAETIEPGYAEKMADMFDDDPARVEAKAEVKRLGEVQKVRRQLTKSSDGVDVSRLGSDVLPSAAWKNVGALVAGRQETQQPIALLGYVSRSGGFSLEEAYPVLSWYVENAARRFTTQTAASQNTLPLAESLLVSTEIGVSLIAKLQAKRLLTAAESPPESSGGMIVRHKDRVQAMEFIRGWLRENGRDEVFLCDPYFGPSEVEFLKILLSEVPKGKLTVIANKDSGMFDFDKLLSEWRAASDQDPPQGEVLLVSGDEGRGAIHDRWLIAGDSGLRFGTSLNALGRGKLSEISILDEARVRGLLNEISPYLRRERLIDGMRLRYSAFTL